MDKIMIRKYIILFVVFFCYSVNSFATQQDTGEGTISNHGEFQDNVTSNFNELYTHKNSDGSEHANVATNTTHISSSGASHTYIDQDVTSGAAPTLVGTNVSGTAAGLTAGAVSTITGLAPDTATTQAVQPNITTLAACHTVGTIGTGVWNGTSIADAYIDNDITITSTANVQGKFFLSNGVSGTSGRMALYEDPDSGGSFVQFQAPDALTTTYRLEMPQAPVSGENGYGLTVVDYSTNPVVLDWAPSVGDVTQAGDNTLTGTNVYNNSNTFSGTMVIPRLSVEVYTETATDTITAAQCTGGKIISTGTSTLTLPPVVTGMSCAFKTFGTNVLTLELDATGTEDTFRYNGTNAAQGEALVSSGTTGDLIVCTYDDNVANLWDCDGDGFAEASP
jgi:hypothetical protein